MAAIRIAIVGIGKITRDQHFPAIADNPELELVATVAPRDPQLSLAPHFSSVDALIERMPGVDAVAICTPPQVRHAIAARALDLGLHVFLEKPPAATLSEVNALSRQAARTGKTLFASWHSRYAAGVSPAKAWLADRAIESVSIVWREDVRVWHPGQAWIWEPGGLGVFDPGINALSILTEILPRPVLLKGATLSLPENRAAPIAADIDLCDAGGVPIHMDLDWRQTGPQSWDIVVKTSSGDLTLSQGGAVLTLPSGTTRSEDREYPALYERFVDLIQSGQSDVDVAPFTLMADAFLRGHRKIVEPFHD